MKPEDTRVDEAILCRAAYELPATATGEMMFMPGGLQTITPFEGGIGQPITVMVDKAGADELEKQRVALTAKGKRPYFDFEHEDKGASYWPEAFYWKEGSQPGIYCRGEWTADGKAGVEGKKWRMFSPVFHVDSKRARPARLVCRDFASANMGGLVNEPAFTKISPLWAKNAGGAHSANLTVTDNNMNEQELAALRAKNQELTTEIAKLKSEQAAIKAKNESDEFIAARIAAKEAEVKANSVELELAAVKAKNADQAKVIEQHNKELAEATVAAAIERGAISAKDTVTADHWKADITARPEQAAILAKMGGTPALNGQRLTTSASSIQVTGQAPNDTIKAYGALVARNAAIPLSAATAVDKTRIANEAAAIFAKDISGDRALDGMSVDDAIKAADYNDPNSNVGLLSGSLVIQKALAQFAYEYPIFSQITTDFSAEPGEYNQTANTRIVLKPAVQSYDGDLNTDGRPKGWVTTSPAQSVDVPVKLDSYYGVPLVFGINTLASTVRDLFGESAPMALYALGGAFVDKITALLTAANFNAYAGSTDAGVETTSGSATIVVTSSAICYPGQRVSGTGIPANSFVKSITDATHVVLNNKATATATITGTFGTGKVPNLYATYAKALQDFNTASIADLKAAFGKNEVPMQDRFLLLDSTYHGRLGQDPIFNMFAAMQKPDMITKGALPEVQTFTPIEAPWFPSANNGVGFAGHKAGLVIKSRLPQNLSQTFAAGAPGNISTVIDPATKLAVSLVQFWNLQTNAYEWRPEVLCGAAVGDRRGGLLLTSQ